LIREDYREEVDLAHLPAGDPAVYEALQKADTVGMFQVESRAQMSCLPRLNPTKFYDIVVQVGIIRPGPIVGKMVHPYLQRRQGKEPPEYFHPSLEPVLRRTLGVPIFQEQLLRMAMIASGFSGAEAEELRRAFSHKRSEMRMKELEGRLRQGMERNGIFGKTQDAIVHSISSFALYGFPESHAASFALIAYASAYLKCHYLAAFTAAILNNQPMGFYNPQTLVKDAQRHGLRFKPVDIGRSDWLCAIEEFGGQKYVRLGFNYIRGFHEADGHAVVEERKCAPFSSIRDLVRRVGLRKDTLKRLAEAGAFNSFDGTAHRREALWQSELAVRPAAELLEPGEPFSEPSPLTPMNATERLAADFRNTGLTIGPHPMSFQREEMNRMGVTKAAGIRQLGDGAFVRIAGSVICRQRPGTAKGFLFLSLEDESGIANAIVTPGLFDAERATLASAPFLLIEGRVQNQEGVVSVKASKVESLCTSLAAVESHDFR
jgi:error-prone DNA polymerase